MVRRFPRNVSLALVLSAALAACQPAPVPDAADLVLTHGKIVTVDDVGTEATALAARDGKIVAIGDQQAVEALIGEGTEVIDLGGRLAIPGFIEGHGHFMGLGDSRIQLDLRAADSWDELVAMVAEAAGQAEPGQWIRGRGWHQDKWSVVPEPQLEGFPLHYSLSAVSPDHPVLLTHASGHALFANAKAMSLAGIDGDTPDPQGGEILRDATGQATGLFRETAQGLIHLARDSDGASQPQEQRRMAELAARECLAKGITSFQDAGSSFEVIDFLRGLVGEGFEAPRLWMMVRAPNNRLRSHMASLVQATAADVRLRVGGIKLSIDGALGARGAWLLEPYSDSPGSTGLNLVPLDTAREAAEIAVDSGAQLCIHAIGDRANREVLDLYAEAFAAHPDKKDLRWRIEHAQHLHLDDIPRFAELGVIASMQGVHCTSDAPWVPDRLGDQRSEEGAYVWQKLMQSGAVVTNGTDTPVEDVSPIASYYSSVSRLLPDGSRFYPDQRMSRLEALKSYTRNVAYSAFEEGEKGTLEVGKLADITVLSQDILTVAEEAIPATKVVYTIVGGEVLHRGGT